MLQKDTAAALGVEQAKLSSPIVGKVNSNVTFARWDAVYFGSYIQNAEGSEKKPIKWRILSVDGDDVIIESISAIVDV